jgi:PhoH-like ATPase
MGIHPLNLEQRFSYDLLMDNRVSLVTLVGPAGTGKTLLALACGIEQVIGKHACYEKILVARPIIPMGKDIGYLPGTKDQKLNYWMQPIFDNIDFLLNKNENEMTQDRFSKRDNKMDYLLDTGLLEVEALTYIRGRSIPNQFIVIDEAQNLTPHEVKTIISRAGKGSKIVLAGDPEQIDNPYLDANSNGLTYTAERMKQQRIVGHIYLSKSERSELASIAAAIL